MLRHVLLGVGITLIIISLVLLQVDLVNFKGQEMAKKEQPSNSRSIIIQKAKKLGMTFPGKSYKQEISLRQGIDLKQALPETKSIDQIGHIITEAKELGMIFPKDKDSFKVTLVPKINLSQILSKPKETKQGQEKKKEEVIKDVKIYIPQGMKSGQVAELLVSKGLLKEEINFINLLNKFNIENKVMAGKYTFPANISSLELLSALIAPQEDENEL
ncbi:hypothetical protein JCM16358_07480 [Halanaerocella petrolearia]